MGKMVEMRVVWTFHRGFFTLLPGLAFGRWFVNLDFLFWMVELQFRREDVST